MVGWDDGVIVLRLWRGSAGRWVVGYEGVVEYWLNDVTVTANRVNPRG